jgi:hypothetical protein
MKKNGFTAFFAVLVSSLALAVGLAMYDLLVRELSLSQMATQSQYAIDAADTGAECALYWDAHATTTLGVGDADNSAFATSTDYTTGGAANGPNQVTCNGQDIYTYGQFPGAPTWTGFTWPPGSATSWTTWSVNPIDATHAQTTFYVYLGTASTNQLQPCAKVTVIKGASLGGPSTTTIKSLGYNTCANNGIVRLERSLRVDY